jgi:8-oxo-dGTP pyrophosphatase MutT (NUDIX family)
MLQEKSCGIIIYREDKIRYYLLLKYNYGHWEFVKGHTEKGEKEKETAIREAGEETGITKDELTFIPHFKEKISYTYTKEEKMRLKKVVFFLAKTQKHDIRLSYEHINYAWLPYKEAKKKLTYLNAKNLLQKADKALGKNISFHHGKK